MSKEEKSYFDLVIAEVVFDTDGKTLRNQKVQFLTKFDEEVFPVARLTQLQARAAELVSNACPEEERGKLTVHEIFILGLNSLGYMTDAEFYGQDAPEEPQDPVVDEPATPKVRIVPNS